MNIISQIIVYALTLFFAGALQANGVLRSGIGSESMSLGGSSLTLADDGLSAMNHNPANLVTQENTIEVSGTFVSLDGKFSNSGNNSIEADSTPGFIPDFAYTRILTERLTIGFSLNPISALEADWNFLDVANAGNDSYGFTQHKSSFLVLRSAIGAGYQVNNRLSLGASIGLMYNRNRLKAPYSFQSHPILANALGAKVSADLETDGFGINGVFGVRYQVDDDVVFTFSYTAPSRFDTSGDIKGNVQRLGIGYYSYDAEVETAMPQILQFGFAWHASSAWRVGLQVDWIDWSSAFDDLPLHLTNGTNAILNGALGSNQINDTSPLNWDDRTVYRFSSTYQYSRDIQFRIGYSYADSPVPASTATPMSAAIMEHTLSFGAGIEFDNYVLDFGYQWNLPSGLTIATSQLLNGEYKNSNIDVNIHWLSIALSIKGI